MHRPTDVPGEQVEPERGVDRRARGEVRELLGDRLAEAEEEGLVAVV